MLEHQVQEQAVAAAAADQPDQVVLAAERDQDVLDLALEPEVFHGAHLGADDIGVAGGGDVQVELLLPPIVPSAIPLV